MERERVTIRIQPALLARIRSDLVASRLLPISSADDLSSWLSRAAREYLGHRRRNRNRRSAERTAVERVQQIPRCTLTTEPKRGVSDV